MSGTSPKYQHPATCTGTTCLPAGVPARAVGAEGGELSVLQEVHKARGPMPGKTPAPNPTPITKSGHMVAMSVALT